MPKPCDTHASQLPCVHFGKCYGHAWHGKRGKALPMREVEKCPYHADVREWWRKNKGGGSAPLRRVTIFQGGEVVADDEVDWA